MDLDDRDAIAETLMPYFIGRDWLCGVSIVDTINSVISSSIATAMANLEIELSRDGLTVHLVDMQTSDTIRSFLITEANERRDKRAA